MSKTLLLIICDFLLISILALVKFEPEVQDDVAQNAENLREDAEEEMIELLEMSLQHESERRSQAEETAKEKEQALESTEANLRQTRESLQEMESEKQSLAQEKSSLESNLQNQTAALEESRKEQQALNESLSQREQRLNRLQKELQEAQQVLEAKESALAQSEEQIESLAKEQQELQTNLKIRETEKKILEENLTAAKTEVEHARVEAEKARQRAERLASGVSELAASSTELTRKIEESQEVSMNATFDRFRSVQTNLQFQYRQRAFLGSQQRTLNLNAVIVKVANQQYAVFASPGTPFAPDASGIDSLQGTLQLENRRFRIKEISYLSEDRQLVGIQIPDTYIESLSADPFNLESSPLRFSEAVLIDNENNYYSEFPIKLAPNSERRLRMEDKLFNRLFGEFSPSQGDYLFSKNGNFMGVMVNNNEALIFRNLSPVENQQLN